MHSPRVVQIVFFVLLLAAVQFAAVVPIVARSPFVSSVLDRPFASAIPFHAYVLREKRVHAAIEREQSLGWFLYLAHHVHAGLVPLVHAIAAVVVRALCIHPRRKSLHGNEIHSDRGTNFIILLPLFFVSDQAILSFVLDRFR